MANENMHDLINIQPILFIFLATCAKSNKHCSSIVICLRKQDDLTQTHVIFIVKNETFTQRLFSSFTWKIETILYMKVLSFITQDEIL